MFKDPKVPEHNDKSKKKKKDISNSTAFLNRNQLGSSIVHYKHSNDDIVLLNLVWSH